MPTIKDFLAKKQETFLVQFGLNIAGFSYYTKAPLHAKHQGLPGQEVGGIPGASGSHVVDYSQHFA
jgi:hypothetical protein